MTPASIIALVRDVAVIAAIGLLAWWLYSHGEQTIKTQDLAAVQKQIAANAAELIQQKTAAAAAEVQHAKDIASVTALVGAHDKSLIVQLAPNQGSPGAVSSAPSQASAQSAASGPADPGRGIDLRPAIRAFELKYESALADCREALSEWPQ